MLPDDASKAMQPILLVGAGRSGTNLLSMALGASDELENVYEQRYIWTKGMGRVVTDMRHPDSATKNVKNYIRAHFARQAEAVGTSVRIVDKTPGNALRLGFCLRVFPNAKVINVIRDPMDNIASRIVELQKSGHTIDGGDAVVNPPSRKAVMRHRFQHLKHLIRRGNLPLDRLPAAALDQIPEKLNIMLRGKVKRYAERVPGLSEIGKAQGQVAALFHQWREVVSNASREGQKLSAEQYLELRYEDSVQSPKETGRIITNFVGLEDPTPVVEYLTQNARSETIGNWLHRLTEDQKAEIRDRLSSELQFMNTAIKLSAEKKIW